MLAYRHQFHAGNFADVFKHALLAQLVLALEKKDKPFFCLDTHAGIAHYDLMHEWTQKNAEYKDGIELVWARKDAPPEMTPYLDAVRAENPDGKLRYYPGSPRIVRRLMRSRDRLVLTELNRKDCESLATLFARDRQVTVEFSDGYQALKAHLPPKERRGLVFIDSSFDRAQEFKRLTQGFAEAYKKFATGVYALWYPLMEPLVMQAFERRVEATGIRKILQLEISVHPREWTLTMRGCGLLVVNPPYGFEAAARAILAWLWPVLSRQGDGEQRVRWLAAE
jgi:23S rRNA (adenine2030-N6)-methyltransferase